MTHRQRKIFLIVIVLAGISCVVGLVLYALKQNIDLYFTPTQIIHNEVPENAHLRIGGMVKKGSVYYNNDNAKVSFILSDTKNEVTVYYQGILPDLFREGQGIVANGRLSTAANRTNKEKRVFVADEVLAKHDENYMPPLVSNAKP